MLASCRLVVTTDGNGKLVSDSGSSDCEGSVCYISIEEPYRETFRPVAAEGYRFAGWTGLCQPNAIPVCRITLAPLTEEFREFDGDLPMGVIFEPTTTKRAWYRDRDGDRYGAANKGKMAFEQPEGFVGNNLDCDDSDGSVYPRAEEQFDGVDNDCDDRIDEGFAPREFYQDLDRDGFGNPEISRLELERPPGYVANSLDCNDLRSSDNPEAQEAVDGRDNDCDGKVDEGENRFFKDVDGDGFGRASGSIVAAEPVAGYVRKDGDCDDNNAAIYPGAEEQFDSTDNDCDGAIDEGFTQEEYFRDVDGDGFGDDSDFVLSVTQPAGYVANGEDNCVSIANPSQRDTDQDGLGDACDPFTDTDEDGNQDSDDNCPSQYNPNQRDTDGDGLGDECDNQNGLDLDNDGVNNSTDNCPEVYNPSQANRDNDEWGDACDEVDDSADGGDEPPAEIVVNGGCSITSEERSMLTTVNAVRAQARVCGSRGSFPAVSPLAWNCKLEAAALRHSKDMAEQDFFSHTGSDGSTVGTRTTQAGYSWSRVGENIAAGTPLSSVGAVVQAWVDSPGHCENIMRSSYTELGAAKYSENSSRYGVYWTQVFGNPR